MAIRAACCRRKQPAWPLTFPSALFPTHHILLPSSHCCPCSLEGKAGRTRAGRAGCCISLIHLTPSQAALSAPISLYRTHSTKGQTCTSTPPWSRVGGCTWLCKSKFGNILCISSSGSCNYQLLRKEKMIVVFLCPQKDSLMSAQGYPRSLLIKMKS